MTPTILCICGPTASGKSSLAFKVASLLPKCTVISVDSKQIYKDLSILTGKDLPVSIPQNVKFYGSDELNTGEAVNIALFFKRIIPIIKQNLHQNIPIILVGGSGLYFKALTSNLSDLFIPPDNKLRDRLSLLNLPDLQKELKNINEDLFNKLNHSDQCNPRRLIRHIEKLLSPKTAITPSLPQAEYFWAGLSLSNESQKSLIEKRVRDRIANGVIQEVSSVIERYPNQKLPLFTSLGVKEITLFLQNKISKDELINSWTQSEYDYAHRQMVWFKKQSSIIWYDESKDRDSLAYELSQILKSKNEKR